MLDLPPQISDWLLLLVKSQRFVAHMLVDGNHALAGAGGELEHYGLIGLQQGRPACEQLPFLEGLLPLPESPFLIRSLTMPSRRVADVHFFAEGDAVWIVLLDVTAEHDDAQKVQQKAYDMTLLSQREARLLAKLEAAHKDLTLAHQELAESREALLRTHTRLQQELRDAERYVLAILPAPITNPFAVDWRFVPSTELGGDSFGYHWIDSDHFALYLLDVCGHGVGSALLSVAVTNTLRAGALLNTDFRMPDAVLRSLNQGFQMEHQNDLYFTIWYGVYHRPTGRLRYASAGHPAPILVCESGAGRGEAKKLPAEGAPIGLWPTTRYDNKESMLAGPAQLFLFSDGAFEIMRPDGTMLGYEAFAEVLTRALPNDVSVLDEVLGFVREVRGAEFLEDDFSIVRMSI
jgi:serine phosphatase RsbU (regulator of sigma subunit)